MGNVYAQFHTFDFAGLPSYKSTLEQVFQQYLVVLSDNDLEVKQDLSNGHFNYERIPPKEKEQLELQTKCFVFCSETGHILELDGYSEWLAGGTEEEYQSNYENIVNLIVNNEPVPGIAQIPDTLLSESDASKHELPQRRKPWESAKETPKIEEVETNGDAKDIQEEKEKKIE